MDDIMVSVSMTSYNHGPYIAQAIEGVLMQKTNFKIELLVHDDASTDNSQEVIRQYEAKYPEIIKPIYQKENQYSKKNGAIFRLQAERAKGKYYAVCEGDDYWTDENKLQKQVDFLESHPEYIAAYHNVRCVDKTGEPQEELQIYPIEEAHDVDFDLFYANWENWMVIGQTASLVYRNIWKEKSAEFKNGYYDCKANGDEKLSMMLVCLGKVRFMSETMADHRRVLYGGSSWSATTRNQNMYRHRYYSRKGIAEYIKKTFDRDLNADDILRKIVYSAVAKALHSPTKVNLKIAIDVFCDYEAKMSVVKMFFDKIRSKVIKKNA